jgi:hypothetical protein
MFDFEKLEVYGKAKKLNNSISSFIGNRKIDKVIYDQLRRTSFNIMLNFAPTIALSIGLNIGVLSKILGHNSIKVTLDSYGAIIDDLMLRNVQGHKQKLLSKNQHCPIK